MTNKALFEDVRNKWQVTVFISKVSNYTGLQITALAAYILSISKNEDKHVSVFICNKSYKVIVMCDVYRLHQSTI